MTTITDTHVPAPGRCYLDPATSAVRFATRHLFGLAPVRGTMPVLSGAVDVGDPIGTSLVQVELDASGFTTGHQQRDTAVRGARYLDSDAHPTLTFAADGPVRDGAGWRLDGTLTVRGVTRPTRLTITRVAADGEVLVVDAETRVDRVAFGITATRGLAARYLRVSVHARIVRA